MTYPKPGEIVLTDPQTGGVLREQFGHVDAHEHYVTCVEFNGDGTAMRNVKERIKFPWHRVVAVQHEFTDSDGGGREYVDPTEDSDD